MRGLMRGLMRSCAASRRPLAQKMFLMRFNSCCDFWVSREPFAPKDRTSFLSLMRLRPCISFFEKKTLCALCEVFVSAESLMRVLCMISVR